MSEPAELEAQLDSFDAGARLEALGRLATERGGTLPLDGTNVNMHFHSFFSYNARDFSPSHIAWEARKAGLYAAGLCDFDVLDGMEEFLRAGLMLKLRVCAHLETRVYVNEYADGDINSPGEPGVMYAMGAGFARELPPDSPEADGLADYRDRAQARNMALLKRINARLPDMAIDYREDVQPLTPTGSATERHIVKAYIRKAEKAFNRPHGTAEFWSKVIGKTIEETRLLQSDMPSMEEMARTKLVKRGGIGYEMPSPETFPPIEEFFDWAACCGAIPMATWLDGASEGEKDGESFLNCLKGKGAAALNIIPDRNWNISDKKLRADKTAKLNEIVGTARRMELPINIGTEMNKLGLPFTDDLDCPALRPHKDIFIRGARIMVGHSLLLRYAGFPYAGEKADAEFRTLRAKNDFFEAMGGLPAMGLAQAKKLDDIGKDKALSWFLDRKRG